MMAQGDEVHILGEAVHHGEDDRLPADLGQALDEVHQDVRPHLGGDLEGLDSPAGHCVSVLLCWHVGQARTNSCTSFLS